MNSGDPKLRQQLRDLPTGYLLDLLADQESSDHYVVRDILRERGMEPEEVDRTVRRRRGSRLPPSYALWRAGRTFALACTVLVGIFNLVAFYRLMQGDFSFKGTLLLLSAGGMGFGFFLGFKLTTHVYRGARHQLYCGFPLPVGIVDLKTGREMIKPKPLLILRMAVNATVGLVLVLFPLLLIHYLLS